MASRATQQAYYDLLLFILEWRRQRDLGVTKARPINTRVKRDRRTKKATSKSNRKVEAAQ